MRRIFVISDTHLQHANMLNFLDEKQHKFRGDRFPDQHTCDEYMVSQWNSVVTIQDIVYHLGDVYFGDSKTADILLSRLNGHKRLILGNHDKSKDPVLDKHFEKITMGRQFKEYGVIMSHIPLHSESLSAKFPINLHGHIHQRLVMKIGTQVPDERYINMAVEHWNYQPQLIENALKRKYVY